MKPVIEGSQRVDFDVQNGHLVAKHSQVDRHAIMDAIQDERRDGRRQKFLGGYKVGSIPIGDMPWVQSRYPDLFSKEADHDTKRKALVRFSNDPEMQPYLIKKA